MRSGILCLVGLIIIFGRDPAESAIIVVDAKTVIFAAGGNGNPDPMGIVPNSIPLPAGPARSLSLSAVSGSITPLAGSAAFGADGGNFFNLPYTVLPHAGIAGINDPDIGFTMPLVGVFTSGVPLQASRPANRTGSHGQGARDSANGPEPAIFFRRWRNFVGSQATLYGSGWSITLFVWLRGRYPTIWDLSWAAGQLLRQRRGLDDHLCFYSRAIGGRPVLFGADVATHQEAENP